jgi:exosome complex component MTR3
MVEAGIDCVDLVAGGVAAITKQPGNGKGNAGSDILTVLDPSPSEHAEIVAACVVGYLAERDEIIEMWLKGDAGDAVEGLVDKAVEAAVATRTVLAEAVMEAAKAKFPELAKGRKAEDVEMVG